MRKTNRMFVQMGIMEQLSISRFAGPLPLRQSVVVVLPYIISMIAITIVCCHLLHGFHAPGDTVVVV